MFTKKFTVIISFFLIIAIGIGGMLGYYDARLEAAVTPKKQSMDTVSYTHLDVYKRQILWKSVVLQ